MRQSASTTPPRERKRQGSRRFLPAFALIGILLPLSGEHRAMALGGDQGTVKDVQTGGNDLWLIDTHGANIVVPDEARFGYPRYLIDTGKSWETSGIDRFFETHDPAKPTLVVIHGNRSTFREAIVRARLFHRLIGPGDYRLVMWVWPAERIGHRPRPDAQIKAARSETEADHLLRFLHRFPAESEIALAGFSFGARTVCTALHRLATTDPAPQPLRIRAALLAPAMDQMSLTPGRRYGRAIDAVEKMLVFHNRDDETLRFYPMLYGCHGPRAIGITGPPLSTFPPDYQRKVLAVDAARRVGVKHDFIASFAAFRIDRRFADIALFAE